MGVAEPVQTAPKPATSPKRKARLPRVPPEKLFEDFVADGSLCVPHVIVGGGTAAWSAVQAIRKRDASASILLVTEERMYPYNRTSLSKELWAPGSAGLFTSEVGTRGAVEYSYAGVEGEDGRAGAPIAIVRGQPVVGLDVDARTVTLADGLVVQYQKLLLVTGGRRERLRVFAELLRLTMLLSRCLCFEL